MVFLVDLGTDQTRNCLGMVMDASTAFHFGWVIVIMLSGQFVSLVFGNLLVSIWSYT
jgi:hypothetical protein